MAETIYDVAVIGAGPAGAQAAGLSKPPDAACLGTPLWKGEVLAEDVLTGRSQSRLKMLRYSRVLSDRILQKNSCAGWRADRLLIL